MIKEKLWNKVDNVAYKKEDVLDEFLSRTITKEDMRLMDKKSIEQIADVPMKYSRMSRKIVPICRFEGE